MNARIFLSINLLAIALVLVLLPKKNYKMNYLKPGQQLEAIYDTGFEVPIDLAARFLKDNDTSIQFIDLRSPEEFKSCNIPGSINIPYEQLLDKNLQGYLNQKDKINILYANGDLISNLSLTFLNGMGYKNNRILAGGLNKWFSVVMNTEFQGGRLSARENALYENRRIARDLFTELNGLPDSLKNTFLEAKALKEEQLDGGCE